jgi:hypothetical protein
MPCSGLQGFLLGVASQTAQFLISFCRDGPLLRISALCDSISAVKRLRPTHTSNQSLYTL